MMNKEKYIDLMKVVFSAYSDEEIKAYTESVMKTGTALTKEWR